MNGNYPESLYYRMPKGRHGKGRAGAGTKKKERAVRQVLKRERKAGAYLSPGDPDFRSFSNQLAVQGLRLHDVPADGNCLFHALSDQLCDGHSSHVSVRRSVVKYMREYCEDFAPFVEDDFSFEDHVSELAKDGVYAGNDAIVAFARCYGVSVVIHQLNAPRWEVHAPAPTRGRTLHVAYLNEEHYCSVQQSTLPPLTAAKPQGSQPQSVNPCCGDGGGWRGGAEEEIMARVVESTGCQDRDLVERCLLENGYDSDLTIVELLQLMDLSVDHSPAIPPSSHHGLQECTQPANQPPRETMHGGGCGDGGGGRGGGSGSRKPPAQPQRHLSNRERKEQAKAARKERRVEERTKKERGQEEHDFIGAMAI